MFLHLSTKKIIYNFTTHINSNDADYRWTVEVERSGYYIRGIR